MVDTKRPWFSLSQAGVLDQYMNIILFVPFILFPTPWIRRPRSFSNYLIQISLPSTRNRWRSSSSRPSALMTEFDSFSRAWSTDAAMTYPPPIAVVSGQVRDYNM